MEPTRYGLTKPPRFPTELIQAMPTPAAAPERGWVGMDQKEDCADRIPMAARARARIRVDEDRPGKTLQEKATAARTAASRKCHRRSPALSEWWPQIIMPVPPHSHGMAERRPILHGSALTSSFRICGSQKLRP